MTMPNRRQFLGFLGATALANTAFAADSLCTTGAVADLSVDHPYTKAANIRYNALLQDQEKNKLPPLAASDLAARRDKDCVTCERVINRMRTELVWHNDGSLPILLAIPHGGTELVLEVNPRQNRDTAEQFTINSAIYTYDMARIIRRVLEDKFNQKPYMVACLAHRRYVDVNRAPKDAYIMRSVLNEATPEDTATLPMRYRRSGAPIYFEYHCALQRYIGQMYRRYNKNALLIELSGGFSLPQQVAMYTLQGKSLTRLRQRKPQLFNGNTWLAPLIENRGYEADPPSALPYPSLECASQVPLPASCRIEAADNAGEYTLDKYGSHQPAGIDAIQLNVGRALRTTDSFERTARDLGNVLVDFIQAHYLT